MYSAIDKAMGLFESTDSAIMKLIVVLSDGATSDTSMHNSIISVANNRDIRVYTVGLGSSSSSYFTSYLKPLSNNTGAAFYLASKASELTNIYKDISKKIDITTDSDSDGVPDYYEDNMVLFSGVSIKLDKNNPDTDGDGLTDGEEVKLTYTYNEDKSKVIVKGKIISDPQNKDTDDDGIVDKDDTDPLTKGLANGIIGKLSLVSCYNSENAGWTSGHVFFVYTSYIKDSVDFSTLAAGWSKVNVAEKWSWSNLKKNNPLLSNYKFSVGESATIGNGAFDSGWFGIGDGSGSSGSSGGSGGESSASGVGDENGVCYNMETYKHFNVKTMYPYLKNTYISEEITEAKLKELIGYCSKGSVNYWNLTHNCAEVACQAWNIISDTKANPYSSDFLWGKVATPKGLKINLRKLASSKEDYSLADALSK